LEWYAATLRCEAGHPNSSFPVVDGVPVLVNEAKSVFTLAELASGGVATATDASGAHSLLSRIMPDINLNVRAPRNYTKLARLLRERSTSPRVLVIGGRVLGYGMDRLLQNCPGIELVETDVAFGLRTALICDAHDLPFDDASFDGVIIQAVLECVVDPKRCVEEVHRVLKPNGLVYAETPFMQQVHAGAYDFTRFTHLGHRYLFRDFSEIESGVVCGPSMALCWSVQYFLTSFTRSRRARQGIRVLVRLSLFWLKYLDRYLAGKPGSLDAASGLYFMGTRSERTLHPRELVRLYRGIIR
jgi:SAM-dependent methyltransferase